MVDSQWDKKIISSMKASSAKGLYSWIKVDQINVYSDFQSCTTTVAHEIVLVVWIDEIQS